MAEKKPAKMLLISIFPYLVSMRKSLKEISTGLLIAFFIGFGLPATAPASTDTSAIMARKKKKNRKEEKKEETPSVSEYKKITGRDSVVLQTVANVFHKEDSWYLEIPVAYMNREFLVVNRLQQVPKELNEAGVNKGINYENQVVTFEWTAQDKAINIRQQHLTPEVPSSDQMALSVKDNYISPLIASLKVEAVSSDSSTVIVKVDELFNGKKQALMMCSTTSI